MNSIDKILSLADDYADWAEAKGKGHPAYAETRQALHDELVRLFTPLSDEQVAESRAEANRGYWIEADHYRKAFRDAEQAHGIGERNEQ